MKKPKPNAERKAIALSKRRTGSRAMLEALATGSLDLSAHSIHELLALHDAYRAAGRAFMHAANEPRGDGLEIIDAWWGTLEGLADHIVLEVERRAPETCFEAEDRGKLIISHAALCGESFSKIASVALAVFAEKEKLK